MIETRIIRRNLRLSQEELGMLIGVHGMTVSKWERGILKPNRFQEAILNTVAKSKNINIAHKLFLKGTPFTLYLVLKSVYETNPPQGEKED